MPKRNIVNKPTRGRDVAGEDSETESEKLGVAISQIQTIGGGLGVLNGEGFLGSHSIATKGRREAHDREYSNAGEVMSFWAQPSNDSHDNNKRENLLLEAIAWHSIFYTPHPKPYTHSHQKLYYPELTLRSDSKNLTL